MAYLTVDQIKKHLNIESDFTEDDEYLEQLEQVAEDSVAVNLDVTLADIETRVGVLPPAVSHAMLLMVGNLYANREPIAYTTIVNLPLSYNYLIALYKNYDGKTDDDESGNTDIDVSTTGDKDYPINPTDYGWSGVATVEL